MTNHVSLILKLETEDELQKVLKPLHMRYTQYINKQQRWSGVLLAVKNGVFKGTPVKDRIKTIGFPGMGTGVGQVSPDVFAKQMKQAVEDVIEEKFEFPQTI